MRRPEWIARQSSCPTGLLGRFLVRLMAVETTPANNKALELLAIQPHDQVLEIGFGHGRTLARAATFAYSGLVAGIDVSADMIPTATRWNQQLITRGRVEVQCASSLQIPYPAQRFDRIYATHTLYFWDPPLRRLQEIHRVMKPGVRFVLTFGPREDEKTVAKFPSTVYRFHTTDEVQSLLAEAGFSDIRQEHHQVASRTFVFAIAHRAAASTEVELTVSSVVSPLPATSTTQRSPDTQSAPR